ncbi:MAG: hypothetical protein K0B06_10555 [Brevefilum sp.]|nr:hypothetical protein [Brevefilum sp.]
MKNNPWKTVIIIGTSTIIIFLIFFTTRNFRQINTQPIHTQFGEVTQTEKEIRTINIHTITKTETTTQDEMKMRFTITNSATNTQKPTLKSLFNITPSLTFTNQIISPTEIPIYPTLKPTEIIETQTPLPPQPTEIIETPLPPPPTQMTTVFCGVSPNTIPGGTLTTQMYWAQFSPAQAGLGFDLSFDIYGPGQRSCSAVSDSSGYASCEGSAGTFPFGKQITVTFRTSIGNCITYINTN